MRYFYIDFENVKNESLTGLEHLGEHDIIHIFYSKKANMISFENHINIYDDKDR